MLGIRSGQTDHYVSRTQPQGARSGPGDTDLTLYSLRKYMRLATDGNPTVLTVLYAPQEAVQATTYLGNVLRSLAPQIVSRRASRRPWAASTGSVPEWSVRASRADCPTGLS